MQLAGRQRSGQATMHLPRKDKSFHLVHPTRKLAGLFGFEGSGLHTNCFSPYSRREKNLCMRSRNPCKQPPGLGDGTPHTVLYGSYLWGGVIYPVERTTSPDKVFSTQTPWVLEPGHAICTGEGYAFQQTASVGQNAHVGSEIGWPASL